MRRALAYLDNHFYEDCTVGDLAEKLGLNRSYLQRIFKEETEANTCSVSVKFTSGARLPAAEANRSALAEVSDYVGFSSQQYFNHVFVNTRVLRLVNID